MLLFNKCWDNTYQAYGFHIRIWEALLSVLLEGGTLWVDSWKSLLWRGFCTMFHDDQFWHAGSIKVIASKIWQVSVLVLLMENI
jgi:hypothetical protein